MQVERRWRKNKCSWAGVMLSTLLLLLTPCFCSRFFRSGSWVLVSLYLLPRICPNCTCSQLFLVSYFPFVFCCYRRGLSRCKYCSIAAKVPGPSLSHPPLRLYTLILKGYGAQRLFFWNFFLWSKDHRPSPTLEL